MVTVTVARLLSPQFQRWLLPIPNSLLTLQVSSIRTPLVSSHPPSPTQHHHHPKQQSHQFVVFEVPQSRQIFACGPSIPLTQHKQIVLFLILSIFVFLSCSPAHLGDRSDSPSQHQTVNLPLLHPSIAFAVNDTVHHRIPVGASNPSEPERPLLLPTKPVHVAVDLPESGLA